MQAASLRNRLIVAAEIASDAHPSTTLRPPMADEAPEAAALLDAA